MATILNWFKGKSQPKVEKVPIDITVEELRAVQQEKVMCYMVDLRDQAQFRSGHIKGSHLLPYAELNRRMHELPDEGLIVTVDSSPRRGRQAAKLLRSYTYDARNLKGGVGAWTEKLVK